MWELETAYSLWFFAKVKTLDGVHGMLITAGIHLTNLHSSKFFYTPQCKLHLCLYF